MVETIPVPGIITSTLDCKSTIKKGGRNVQFKTSSSYQSSPAIIIVIAPSRHTAYGASSVDSPCRSRQMEFSMRSFSSGQFAFRCHDTILLCICFMRLRPFQILSSDGESLCVSYYGHGLHSVGHHFTLEQGAGEAFALFIGCHYGLIAV